MKISPQIFKIIAHGTSCLYMVKLYKIKNHPAGQKRISYHSVPVKLVLHIPPPNPDPPPHTPPGTSLQLDYQTHLFLYIG